MEEPTIQIGEETFNKSEWVCIQMGVGALKIDLEKNDPDKMSIPSIYIDEVWEKIKRIKL